MAHLNEALKAAIFGDGTNPALRGLSESQRFDKFYRAGIDQGLTPDMAAKLATENVGSWNKLLADQKGYAARTKFKSGTDTAPTGTRMSKSDIDTMVGVDSVYKNRGTSDETEYGLITPPSSSDSTSTTSTVKTDTDSKSGIADWFKGAKNTVTGVPGKVGNWLGNSTNIAGHDVSNKLIAGVGAGTLAAAGTVVGGGVSGRGPLRRLAMGSAAKRRAARSYFKDSRNAATLADEYKKDGNITKANKLLDKSLRRNRSGEEMIRAADAIDRREISKLEKKLSDGRISDVKRYKLERKLEDRKSRLLHSND